MTSMTQRIWRLILVLAVIAGCARAPKPKAPQPAPPSPPAAAPKPPSPPGAGTTAGQPQSANALTRLMPLPESIEAGAGAPFTLTSGLTIVVSEDSPLVTNVAAELQTFLRRATGAVPTILVARGPVSPDNVFALTIDPNTSPPEEG